MLRRWLLACGSSDAAPDAAVARQQKDHQCDHHSRVHAHCRCGRDDTITRAGYGGGVECLRTLQATLPGVDLKAAMVLGARARASASASDPTQHVIASRTDYQLVIESNERIVRGGLEQTRAGRAWGLACVLERGGAPVVTYDQGARAVAFTVLRARWTPTKRGLGS